MSQRDEAVEAIVVRLAGKQLCEGCGYPVRDGEVICRAVQAGVELGARDGLLDTLRMLQGEAMPCAAVAEAIANIKAEGAREENEACARLAAPYHTSAEPCPCQVCTAMRRVRDAIRARGQEVDGE